MKSYQTICQCILDFYNRPPDDAAVQRKVRGRWEKMGWATYIEQIENVARSLEKLGLRRGDRVAIMAGTRLEWALLDFAILGLGGVSVPVYPSVTEEDFAAILQSSRADLLFFENKNHLLKWSHIRNSCPQVREVFTLGEGGELARPWNEFLGLGGEETPEFRSNFKKKLGEAKPQDLATIVYTSGTTGVPKGVRLAHEQGISSVAEVMKRFGLGSRDVTLSFLPYSHVIGRQELWGHAYHGYCLAFAESIEKIRENLLEVKPTCFVAVPRIFEKFYSAISTKLESNRLSRLIAAKAQKLGVQKFTHLADRTPMSFAMGVENLFFDQLFYRKIREAFGGNLRFAISGGAPIHSKILKFFWSAGLPILEGYGLTETFGSITANSVSDFEFGTVGKPLGDVELKFGSDQEIFVRSKKVMEGYEANPEETKKVLTDGWFATGDIGELTPKGFLRITDRKKDLIKTAGGKFVAPQKLEALVKENNQISQVHIHGDQRKFIVALLTLKNPSKSKDPNLERDMKIWMAQVNSRLASYETIKKFKVLDRDFTLEDGELTPSLKLKRKFIDKKYNQTIDELFTA